MTSHEEYNEQMKRNAFRDAFLQARAKRQEQFIRKPKPQTTFIRNPAYTAMMTQMRARAQLRKQYERRTMELQQQAPFIGGADRIRLFENGTDVASNVDMELTAKLSNYLDNDVLEQVMEMLPEEQKAELNYNWLQYEPAIKTQSGRLVNAGVFVEYLQNRLLANTNAKYPNGLDRTGATSINSRSIELQRRMEEKMQPIEIQAPSVSRISQVQRHQAQEWLGKSVGECSQRIELASLVQAEYDTLDTGTKRGLKKRIETIANGWIDDDMHAQFYKYLEANASGSVFQNEPPSARVREQMERDNDGVSVIEKQTYRQTIVKMITDLRQRLIGTQREGAVDNDVRDTIRARTNDRTITVLSESGLFNYSNAQLNDILLAFESNVPHTPARSSTQETMTPSIDDNFTTVETKSERKARIQREKEQAKQDGKQLFQDEASKTTGRRPSRQPPITKDFKPKKGNGFDDDDEPRPKVLPRLRDGEQALNHKYFINRDKLGNGFLEVRYTNNRHLLPNMRTQQVGGAMRRVIEDFVDKQEINPRDFHALNHFEKDSVRKLVTIAGKGHMLNEDSSDLQARFEIALASWNAGNNNSNLREELRAYILHAKKLAILSPQQANSMLMDLNN